VAIERARQLRKQMPASEASLWNALRSLKSVGLHFRRRVPLGRYYADFACFHPRLVIEVDGWTRISAKYDDQRDAFLQSQGFRVLHFANDDVRFNRTDVVRAVMEAAGRIG
jgi:very-short-patch-repair endonuclease